ncbi:hypothetical protein Ahy_A06g030589 [Arachis hypogaea]|uniref:PB1-like domain-containing protein n=1 Tax=Arachis hypogaea TaxID=3818 RepID=A0A445CWQ5_ARAHY|nr:hypothetical protein Ahy_A06g030589 [Arachis hypogaea]
MGFLKRSGDSNVIYDGSLVTEIHRVNVETCNLFFIEELFLDLGYPGYNEVYWLEPGLDLAKGLRMLRTDAEVMRMCESAMKNDNTVHLYFDHPIDANPEIIDEDTVSDGSSESVVEINPPGQTNEKDNEVVNEATGEVNELNKALSVVVNETVNEVVTDATVDVNELNKSESGIMNEDVNDRDGDKDTEGASAPEKGVKKVRKRHPRPPLSGLSQERRVAETGQPEGDHREAETVNESTHEINADDANEGANFGTPILDDLRPEEAVTENAAAPRVEVPNPNRENEDSGPEMYQYEYEELCSPPGFNDEEELVFPQHNPNTPYEKIILELNMKFKNMDHFKVVVQKYNIQIGRYVFYLRNEKKRCRVIYYDPDCPWLDIIVEFALRDQLEQQLKSKTLMRKKLESKKLTERRPWRLHMLHMLQMRRTSLKTIHKVSLIRELTATSTTPPTLTQNAAATPPSPAQPRVVRLAARSKFQILALPSSAAVPCNRSESMPQGPTVRPTLQAQLSILFRPLTVTRKIMAAISSATQSRFTGFMPTPFLKRKKSSGPLPSKPSTNDKK